MPVNANWTSPPTGCHRVPGCTRIAPCGVSAAGGVSGGKVEGQSSASVGGFLSLLSAWVEVCPPEAATGAVSARAPPISSATAAHTIHPPPIAIVRLLRAHSQRERIIDRAGRLHPVRRLELHDRGSGAIAHHPIDPLRIETFVRKADLKRPYCQVG